MSEANALAGLIERLEKATGPDRELDCRIHCAIESDEWVGGLYQDGYFKGEKSLIGYRTQHNDYTGAYAPAYTASVDAALTLVPEGWFVSNLAQWRSGQPHRTWAVTLTLDPICEVTAHTSNRPSAAIALCLASLRAKSQAES